jgi:ankyrin repeat protein
MFIRPPELDDEADPGTWEAISAANAGDVAALKRLIAGDPGLARAEFWYTPAIHFAVREGRSEVVRLLLDAGADPEWNGLHQGSLIEMAMERGYAEIARMLEEARDRRGRTRPGPAGHAIHVAAKRGDVDEVRRLLDADGTLVRLGTPSGATPLHVAACGDSLDVVTLLLDRGADPNALRGGARGLSGGFWTDLQPIDLAIWNRERRSDEDGMVRLLLEGGTTYDLTLAAALGDLAGVRRMLDADPARIRETRPSGRRPLGAAIELGHEAVARFLLERGADPTWGEPTAPKGRALHSAARAGNLELVRLLLSRGADPNSGIDSSGSAVVAAATPEIRALLEEHGGREDPYVTSWVEDDDKLEAVADDPRAANRIGAAFTMIVGDGRRDLLARLLEAGFRMPTVFTGCQTYLLADAESLRTLLAHGMSPDQMNWQHQTLLHHSCDGSDDSAGKIERAALLLDAGADLNARDDEYRSTPLAWAARTNALEMVRFLIGRGAPARLPDDEPWATPLAWAERRGHGEIAAILREESSKCKVQSNSARLL